MSAAVESAVKVRLNEDGCIPANMVCHWRKKCEIAQAGQCVHKGVEHAVQFSCAVARGFDLCESSSKGQVASVRMAPFMAMIRSGIPVVSVVLQVRKHIADLEKLGRSGADVNEGIRESNEFIVWAEAADQVKESSASKGYEA